MKKHLLKRFIDIHVLILCAVFFLNYQHGICYRYETKAINNVNVSDDSWNQKTIYGKNKRKWIILFLFITTGKVDMSIILYRLLEFGVNFVVISRFSHLLYVYPPSSSLLLHAARHWISSQWRRHIISHFLFVWNTALLLYQMRRI